MEKEIYKKVEKTSERGNKVVGTITIDHHEDWDYIQIVTTLERNGRPTVYKSAKTLDEAESIMEDQMNGFLKEDAPLVKEVEVEKTKRGRKKAEVLAVA